MGIVYVAYKLPAKMDIAQLELQELLENVEPIAPYAELKKAIESIPGFKELYSPDHWRTYREAVAKEDFQTAVAYDPYWGAVPSEVIEKAILQDPNFVENFFRMARLFAGIPEPSKGGSPGQIGEDQKKSVFGRFACRDFEGGYFDCELRNDPVTAITACDVYPEVVGKFLKLLEPRFGPFVVFEDKNCKLLRVEDLVA